MLVAILVILGVIVYHFLVYGFFLECAEVRANVYLQTAVLQLYDEVRPEVELARAKQEEAENRLLRARKAISELVEQD